jgi:hypothetical protein
MDKDPEIKDLGIKEVYQLQGGIDKVRDHGAAVLFWLDWLVATDIMLLRVNLDSLLFLILTT